MITGELARVPALVTEVGQWAVDRRVREAERLADVIASGADVLWASPQVAGRAETSPAQVGEALATGLTILAHRPGGVRFGGLHWHAHPVGCCSGTSAIPGMDAWATPMSTAPGRKRGAVFTPRAVADDVVAGALGVAIQEATAADIELLRVADIACGSGAFLVAAARYLADALTAAWDEDERARARDLYGTDDTATAARAVVTHRCLVGVDIDPLSVELTAVALQLLAPTVAPPGPRLPGLRVGDALVGHPGRGDGAAEFPAGAARLDWPEESPDVFARTEGQSCGFDAVVGNPPFLGGLKLTGALGEAYREHLIHAVAGGMRGTADLAAYFWLRAHQLVHRYGVVGVVATSGLLRGATARVGRDQLARCGWRPYRLVSQMTWPARSAAVSVCMVWTHRLADPEDHLRNLPDEPPPEGKFVSTVTIDGRTVHLFRHPPGLHETANNPMPPLVRGATTRRGAVATVPTRGML